MSNILESIIRCPQCRLKTAHWINFGKKARCVNCNHIWLLRWRGAKVFLNKVRLENV